MDLQNNSRKAKVQGEMKLSVTTEYNPKGLLLSGEQGEQETKKRICMCHDRYMPKVIEKLFRPYFGYMFTSEEDHLQAGQVRTKTIKKM